MKQFPKPRLVVSKCLGFASCRYNGEMLHDAMVERLAPFVQYRQVCAEMEIGLGVPRDPVRVVESKGKRLLLQPATGRDCTAEMLGFCRGYLGVQKGLDGFLLKGCSPSCGPLDVKIYSSAKPGASSRRGAGFFGGAARETFPGLPAETEGRLKNFQIREHFLTRIFTLAAFRKARARRSLAALVEFHSQHKLLLMAYNQHQMRALGRLVANPDKKPAAQVMAAYQERLGPALARIASRGAVINVLMHAFGYFSKELSTSEKGYFLDSLEKYRKGKLPLSALLAVLRTWLMHWPRPYLEGQRFFSPYPEELAELGDSGKGRDL